MKRTYDKLTLSLHIMLAAANILCGIVLYPRLPDSVPLSITFSGKPAMMGPKAVLAFVVPAVFLLAFLLLEFAPKIDPRKENYEQFYRRYKILEHVVLLFLSAIYWVHLHLAMGHALAVASLIPVLLGIFLAISGNYIVTIRQNYLFGIRTPWALSSEWNWRKTHRFAGRLWVAAGILVIFCGLIWPPGAFAIVIVSALAPVIYSLVLYLKYESNNADGPREPQ